MVFGSLVEPQILLFLRQSGDFQMMGPSEIAPTAVNWEYSGYPSDIIEMLLRLSRKQHGVFIPFRPSLFTIYQQISESPIDPPLHMHRQPNLMAELFDLHIGRRFITHIRKPPRKALGVRDGRLIDIQRLKFAHDVSFCSNDNSPTSCPQGASTLYLGGSNASIR